MPNRKVLYSILLFLFILSAILAGMVFHSRNQKLEVIFLDVGQGDAVLIEQGNRQILIDGGPDGKKLMEKLGEYVPFWDREIEIVIATHPDQDHIDGLIDVMENYKIGEIIDSGVETDSQIYKKYKETIAQRNINHLEGKRGTDIEFGNNIKLEIISPDGTQDKNNPKDTNAASIVSKLIFKKNNFLFTGDLPSEKERELVKLNTNLGADVLKISHHGSKYATGEEFLNAVKPAEAVISVGKNNRYGHPAPEILDRLNSHKVIIKRTDNFGDIEYEL